MKKRFTFCAAMLCMTIAANAKVWTVNNNTTITNLPSPGQFTQVSDAITAAASGDTIYISGSPTSYNNFSSSTKQLIFIGAGYNPDNQFDFKSSLQLVNITQLATSGSQLIGLTIDNIFLALTNNIKITRCRVTANIIMDYGYSVSNIEITNNIILGYIQIGNQGSITINNNIIGVGIIGSNKSSVLVSNNVFQYSGGGVFSNVTNIVFTNNVLINVLPTGCSFCAMDHNVASNPLADFNYSSTNSSADNQVGVSPLYNVTASPNSFSFNNIYVLQSGSPAINAGSDGTDAGITGGAFPFDLVKLAYPPIPQITLMNMTKSNVPQGADVQFNVKVRTQK